MSVTIRAEFDSVDFAERAARRVKSHFPQTEKAVIKCRQMTGYGSENRTPVSVLSSFSTNFQAVAYTPDAMFSSGQHVVDHTEVDDRREAALEIKANRAQAEKIAGFLITCGGYHVQKV